MPGEPAGAAPASGADAAQPESGPTFQVVPPRPSIGPGNFDRSRIRALGLERAWRKDVYHFVLAQSWPRFFLLTGLLFVLTNLFFGALYWAEPGSVTNMRPGSFEDAFYFSVQT